MNAIRLAASLFILVLIGVSAMGWVWTGTHQPPAQALAGRTVLALARLRSAKQIVLLHYSPIRQTVEGEPLEIYPYVGSSRLEEPISRFPVSLVVHGHAHRGRHEGRTKNDVPVYNVSLPLLQRTFPGRQPFLVLEVAVDA